MSGLEVLMTMLAIRDVSLFVKIVGHGHPVLLMHGGPGLDHTTLSGLEIIERAGHNPQDEKQDEALAILRQFMGARHEAPVRAEEPEEVFAGLV